MRNRIQLGAEAVRAPEEIALAVAPEPFDSDVLHLKIARITSAAPVSADEYATLAGNLARRLRREGFDQLLRRASFANLDEVWGLERSGFELMDVGVTFAQILRGRVEPPPADELVVRPSTDRDIREIASVMVIQPWGSRYEADPAYDPADVRELRARWLWNSHGGRADVVLVGVLDGRPAGYVTCRVDPRTGHGVIELVGTLPDFRGRRVAPRILAHAIAWFSTRATLVTVRTQATNTAAAALYERAGFTLHSSDMTFRLDLRRFDRSLS